VEFAENLLSSRRGTILVGAGAAVLAAILLVVYLNRYRASLKGSGEPVTVLVSKSLIQKGSPGNIIGSTHQFQVASIPKEQLKDGALTDPGALRGLATATIVLHRSSPAARWYNQPSCSGLLASGKEGYTCFSRSWQNGDSC